jgi:hypothetical protein
VNRLADRVQAAVGEGLTGARLILNRVAYRPRVGGKVIWPGFEGMSGLDRQQLLGRVLRERLGPEYPETVSTILTFTPLEWESIEEDRRSDSELSD